MPEPVLQELPLRLTVWLSEVRNWLPQPSLVTLGFVALRVKDPFGLLRLLTNVPDTVYVAVRHCAFHDA